jgi:hypothetical protein
MDRKASIVRTTDAVGKQRLWYVGEPSSNRALKLVLDKMPEVGDPEWVRRVSPALVDHLSLAPDEIREMR